MEWSKKGLPFLSHLSGCLRVPSVFLSHASASCHSHLTDVDENSDVLCV